MCCGVREEQKRSMRSDQTSRSSGLLGPPGALGELWEEMRSVFHGEGRWPVGGRLLTEREVLRDRRRPVCPFLRGSERRAPERVCVFIGEFK